MFTDTYKPHRDGVVTHIEDITKFFIDKGNEVTLFVPGRERFNIKQISKNLEIVELHSFNLRLYEGYRIPIARLKNLKKIFEQKKFDLIHIHSPFTSGVIGIAVSRHYSIPIVGTYHTLLPEYFPYILKGNFQGILKKVGVYPAKKYTKIIYSKLDCVIAPSNEIKKYIESCGVKNVVCIPNGVNINKIKKTKRIDITKKYNFPKNSKLLLFVGRMGFEKKINILLESMNYLENENVFLVLVGSGPYLKKYKKLAKKLKLKNVKFLGYIKDEVLYSLYLNTDLFISPSDTETQGITFLEAMSMGLPVIGINRYGTKEIICDGFNGFLAEPKNPVDLAIKIVKLTSNENLIKKFSKNSKKIVKQYSIKNTAKKLLELYKKLS